MVPNVGWTDEFCTGFSLRPLRTLEELHFFSPENTILATLTALTVANSFGSLIFSLSQSRDDFLLIE
jgi:hypothetical protein